jgi:hypothetical protein
VIRAYGAQKDGKEITDIWHTANNANKSKAKSKAKSKDDSNSTASRQRGFFLPRTDTDFKLDVGVDTLPDLPDCPKIFEYGKALLPN